MSHALAPVRRDGQRPSAILIRYVDLITGYWLLITQGGARYGRRDRAV
jgi:hypothetical protein